MSAKMSGEEPEADGKCTCCSFSCAVLKICCFSCARYTCSCCFPAPAPSKPEFSALCLGLDGAGKTTLLSQLAGEPRAADPQPTMGFSIKPYAASSAVFQIRELGGAEKLRPYWSMYYTDLDAIVFVVDSAVDNDRLTETTHWLQRCLTNSTTEGLPLLVLCNKQDQSAARTAQTISKEMSLPLLCRGRQYKVEGCSCEDVEGLRGAMESLAEMVLAYKNKGRAKMGWVD